MATCCLKRVSDPLIAKTTRKEVQYSFNILDSDEVNAFSPWRAHLRFERFISVG